MKYTDEQKERIRHCFDSFCKKVIRYQAINLFRESGRYAERNVSFEEILNDYFSECGKCDTYPVLQYHFEAFGYIFSVNDYKLGKALLQLPKKKRDVILMYYFTDYKLKDIAELLGKPQQNISYIHIRALKSLREIMERDKDE